MKTVHALVHTWGICSTGKEESVRDIWHYMGRLPSVGSRGNQVKILTSRELASIRYHRLYDSFFILFFYFFGVAYHFNNLLHSGANHVLEISFSL